MKAAASGIQEPLQEKHISLFLGKIQADSNFIFGITGKSTYEIATKHPYKLMLVSKESN